MTKQDLFLLFTIIILVTSVVGSHFGYQVNSVEYGNWASANVTTLSALGDALGFMSSMMTFQVDNIPVMLQLVFVIMALGWLYLIFQLVRGT